MAKADLEEAVVLALALALVNEERAWRGNERDIKSLIQVTDMSPEFYRCMARAAIIAYWRKMNGY